MDKRSESKPDRAQPVINDSLMFRELPATFPEKDKYKKPSFVGSIIFHGLLITVVVLVPLMLPRTIAEQYLLVRLVSPIGPPPPPPPPPVEIAAAPAPRPVQPQVRPAAPEALIMPTAIPRDIAKIVDEPIAPVAGVIGGVPGGMPGGIPGGVLGGLLSANANANAPPALAPPPPPPPPPPKAVAPAEPIRVGGSVREPRPVHVVPPVYPPLASKARVSGTVVLEAVLTEAGTVDRIRVISGHPLLVEAAINCVKQWQYEPTLLNGIPVAVILTAKVNFFKAGPTS